jgi:hypothetical protein
VKQSHNATGITNYALLGDSNLVPLLGGGVKQINFPGTKP